MKRRVTIECEMPGVAYPWFVSAMAQAAIPFAGKVIEDGHGTGPGGHGPSVETKIVLNAGITAADFEAAFAAFVERLNQ